jgi:5'-nucleotidase
VKSITRNVLKHGLPKGIVLNVNLPKLKASQIKGIKICRQANARWEEEFDKRTNPQGRDYYWLTGKFVNEDEGEDSDEAALAQGYVSVVPVQFDLTAHHFLHDLKNWKFDD